MAGPGTRLEPGDELAGYTVISELGSGGMAVVYLARHPRLPRNQALKVLAPGLGGDPAFRARFTREAELAAQLDHPNIVAVQDAGVDDGAMWIAMQYVAGEDAARLIRDRGPLPLDRVADIVAQVAAGLDVAHAHGMLHRDVKPANILVTPGWEDGAGQRVLIGDFGIARSLAESTTLTGTGTMVGTLAYTAPEVLAGTAPTAAVDVYALGCTLYELLAGEPVFLRPDGISMMHAHATAPPPRVTDRRPELPPALDAVLARALAKRPEDRFPTCGALADAVSAAASAVVQAPQPAASAPPTTVRSRPAPERTAVGSAEPSEPHAAEPSEPVRRRPAPLLVTCGVVLLAVVTAVGVFLLRRDESPPTVDATSSPVESTTTRTAVPITGGWRGVAVGDQSGFEVVATITSAAPMRATVEYPQLGCTGTWAEQSRSGDTVHLLETVTRGDCVVSQITLTRAVNDTLGFRSAYYSASRGRTLEITATLRRD